MHDRIFRRLMNKQGNDGSPGGGGTGLDVMGIVSQVVDSRRGDIRNDTVAEIRRREDMADALADHPHLSGEHRRMLRRLAEVERPDDITGWVASQARHFAPAGGAPVPGQPQGRPVSDAGAPSPAPTFTEDTPLWQLDQQSRQRLIREKGVNWYRATLRHQMKGSKIRMGR